MPEPDDLRPVADPAEFGLSVLAQFVEQTSDGVSFFDEQRRRIYVNPSVCTLLGRSQEQLLGTDYLEHMPPGSLPLAAAGHAALLAADAREVVTNTVTGAGDTQREVMFAVQRVDVEGRPHMACLSRDLTESRNAARAAAALAHSAADLVGTASTNDILINIAQHAVEHTRGVAARIMTVDENDLVDFGGGHGPADYQWRLENSVARDALRTTSARRLLAALTADAIVVGERPGRPVVLPDARAAWQSEPILHWFVDSIAQANLHAVLMVPLAWDDRVTGVLMVYFPAGIAVCDGTELAFCSALADHAVVAVANSRLSRKVMRTAAVRERGRLAHELHDSVSQSLFAMTMHARATQLAMHAADFDENTLLHQSVGQLAQLTRDALAEMRALVFQLRPDALVDHDLVGALVTQASNLSAREEVTITVDGPSGRLTLDAEVEAHVYRIVTEALHNVVKHARAENATVVLTVDDGMLDIVVGDDGVGFNSTDSNSSGVGFTTMAQRARTIGASLDVRGDGGCTVSLRVPLDTAAQPRGDHDG